MYCAIPAIADGDQHREAQARQQRDLVVLAEGRDRELLERLRHDVDDKRADREDRAALTGDEQRDEFGDRQEHRGTRGDRERRGVPRDGRAPRAARRARRQPDPRGRRLRHRHRAAAVQGVRDRHVRRVRQDRAARRASRSRSSSRRRSRESWSTCAPRSASWPSGSRAACPWPRSSRGPVRPRSRGSRRSSARWSAASCSRSSPDGSARGGPTSRRARRRRRARGRPAGLLPHRGRRRGIRRARRGSAPAWRRRPRRHRGDPQGPEAARTAFDGDGPRGRGARHPRDLAALHVEPRVLSRRHRTHRPRGRSVGLAPRRRRHGRPAGRVELRRAGRHGPRRVRDHAHVRVERGRRRPARHREVARRAGARGAAPGEPGGGRRHGALAEHRRVHGIHAARDADRRRPRRHPRRRHERRAAAPRARLPRADGRAGPLRVRVRHQVADRAEGDDVRSGRGRTGRRAATAPGRRSSSRRGSTRRAPARRSPPVRR